MREIKFRCWNPIRKVMTGGNHINTILRTTDGDFVNEFEAKKFIWLQYTGLKDKSKNGTCIYEGDIISLQGIIKGNIYENKEMEQDETHLVIVGFGASLWRFTEKEAVDRGCYYSK